jgi:hypothetical protein
MNWARARCLTANAVLTSTLAAAELIPNVPALVSDYATLPPQKLLQTEAFDPEHAPGSEPALFLTLLVYNYADVPVKALKEANREVRRIFRQAGVKAIWLDCIAADSKGAACVQDPPGSLMIRIIPRTSTIDTGHLFGLAFVANEGFSKYATIFFGELRARAKGDEIFQGRILGYAIAHEVGHLLLGRQRHAPTGIMMSGWTTKALRSDVKQFFLFTNREAKQLRANVRARLALERERQSF